MDPADLADLRAAFAPGTPPGPPRWKLIVVTFVSIYPLLLAALPTLGALSDYWPVPLRAAAVVGLLVSSMVSVVVPVLRRVFAGWLRGGSTQPPPYPRSPCLFRPPNPGASAPVAPGRSAAAGGRDGFCESAERSRSAWTPAPRRGDTGASINWAANEAVTAVGRTSGLATASLRERSAPYPRSPSRTSASTPPSRPSKSWPNRSPRPRGWSGTSPSPSSRPSACSSR